MGKLLLFLSGQSLKATNWIEHKYLDYEIPFVGLDSVKIFLRRNILSILITKTKILNQKSLKETFLARAMKVRRPLYKCPDKFSGMSIK